MLGHDGPILARSIALHIDSCGLGFSAEISEISESDPKVT